MAFFQSNSPRARRIRNDLLALDQLSGESDIFSYQATGRDSHKQIVVTFQGRGLSRENSQIQVRQEHHVEIKLHASYPRSMPELRWLSPIYHPNISEIGMVCLGDYTQHWAPSVTLDELCSMLWNMARYENYDVRSPYNREAAIWTTHQTSYRFPLDPRPLHNLRTPEPRDASPSSKTPSVEPLILLEEEETPSGERLGSETPKGPPPLSSVRKNDLESHISVKDDVVFLD